MTQFQVLIEGLVQSFPFCLVIYDFLMAYIKSLHLGGAETYTIFGSFKLPAPLIYLIRIHTII